MKYLLTLVEKYSFFKIIVETKQIKPNLKTFTLHKEKSLFYIIFYISCLSKNSVLFQTLILKPQMLNKNLFEKEN
jgi:hypothetical protein